VRRAIAVGVCALSLVGLSAGAASAGEITGNGKPVERSPHASLCSFSGHNDDPGAPDPEGGTSQSYGQLVRQGLKPFLPSPSEACKFKLGDEFPEE
jgi:hypothetical protein